MPEHPGAAEGERYDDFCKNAECGYCSLWQRPTETRVEWEARLRAIFYADAQTEHVERMAHARRSRLPRPSKLGVVPPETIIDLLETDRWITAKELAEELKVSRSAIHRLINRMVRRGWPVEASRALGYRRAPT